MVAVSGHLFYIHQSVENLLFIQWFRYALSEHPATSQWWEHIVLLDQQQGTHQCGYLCWPLVLAKGFLDAFLEVSISNFLIFLLFFYSPLAICLDDVPSHVFNCEG